MTLKETIKKEIETAIEKQDGASLAYLAPALRYIERKKKCEFCGYDWLAKKEKPRQCPNCKRQIKYKKVGTRNIKTKIKIHI